MGNVQEFITDRNTLLVTVDNTRVYEFRDITPRDMLYIHELGYKYEARDAENYLQSLSFLMDVCKRLLIFSITELENEYWQDFLEINRYLQTLIMVNRLDWMGFLGFIFSSHNKSFSGLHDFMDVPAPIVMDCYDTMVKFFEMQEAAMKKR